MTQPKRLALKNPPKYYPKSRQLLERINEASPRKNDATKLLRAALNLAMEYHPEKVLEAIDKAESRSLF
jgi:hypothetical protein